MNTSLASNMAVDRNNGEAEEQTKICSQLGDDAESRGCKYISTLLLMMLLCRREDSRVARKMPSRGTAGRNPGLSLDWE